MGISFLSPTEFPCALQRLCHARLDEAEADRIHINVVAAPFLCEGFLSVR